MARPASLSGFPEWLPAQRWVEQHVLDPLRRTFELWGISSIETRAVEPLEQLLSKGEVDKEVYVVRRLHADPADPPDGAPPPPRRPRRRRRPGPPARAALRPHGAAGALRAGERRAAAVPVPPVPDP